MSDAILLSADPMMADAGDVSRHLEAQDRLYWTVGYPIKWEELPRPLWGYVHVKGEGVKYRICITEFLPFSPEHYDPGVKPETWCERYRNDPEGQPRATTLVVKTIEEFGFDTLQLKKLNGENVKQPPQSYLRIRDPRE